MGEKRSCADRNSRDELTNNIKYPLPHQNGEKVKGVLILVIILRWNRFQKMCSVP